MDEKRGRGQPHKLDAKVNVTLRLSPEVLERWRATDVVTFQRPYPAEMMTVRGPESPTRLTA
jgi:hypothetical protein